ncbi:MAG: alpha/beta hydrolase [Burkholderiales bacterium]|nr:alpha/beta hydrolase [Burkholderiales bacterium]MDE2076378.1 alpha/beta hydrolase [Burkholderiales bacterium]MDE2432694.1 alpha/beta hydrolase [Burkholderiales bacterium]HET8693401.1 alpha/beta hydrolase [Aquabacterium sp.]
MTTRRPRLSTFVLLAGWNDSGPEHWQSRWADIHSDHAHWVKVAQDDWHWPRRGDWMMQLDEALLAQDHLLEEPAVLVAHSLGCHLVAAWATHSKHIARVRGAWLVAPPDLDSPDRLDELPPQLHGWIKVPRQRLPFPAQVLASTNDSYSRPERAARLAQDWGASFVSLGALGHVNAASGQGDWPQGWNLFGQWVDALPPT